MKAHKLFVALVFLTAAGFTQQDSSFTPAPGGQSGQTGQQEALWFSTALTGGITWLAAYILWTFFISSHLRRNEGADGLRVFAKGLWHGFIRALSAVGEAFATLGANLIQGRRITPSDPGVVALSSQLGTNDYKDSVKNITNFIQQNIEDTDENGWYWQSPSETLTRHAGDCEDQAFLFASLVKSLNYPVRVQSGYVLGQAAGGVFPNHVWPEIDIDGTWVPVDTALNVVYVEEAFKDPRKVRDELYRVYQYDPTFTITDMDSLLEPYLTVREGLGGIYKAFYDMYYPPEPRL